MPPEPLVLGFDTSAAHCAVALICGGEILAEAQEDMTRGQAERLFPLMQEILIGAGRTWQDLDGIGCGTGPGNFTGIRLGVSAARGLALSLARPAIGITIFQAMALGQKGRVLVTINGRRDQVFAHCTDAVRADDPALMDRADVIAKYAGQIDICVGHDAATFADLLGARAVQPTHPIARSIALLAAKRLDRPNDRPKPLYLKQPDAAASRDCAPVLLL